MNDTVYKIDKCRLCGENVHTVVQLEKTPVGDRFVKNRETALKSELHNVNLALCDHCKQIQLSEVVEPACVYDEEYLYVTSVSCGLSEHFRASAREIVERFGLKNSDLVVEIGSNEGIMLEAFKALGLNVLGIDPAKIASDRANARGVETICDFFGLELVHEIKSKKGTASIVIANNVIANIPDLHSVMAGIRELLGERGVFIFETSYAPRVIGAHLIDTIYHEHISYFSIAALKRFFSALDMEFFDAQILTTKGGSLRGYVGQKGIYKTTQRFNELEKNEELSKFSSAENLARFSKNLKLIREKLIALCKENKSRGEKVVIYGASVGCVAMIYEFGISEYIDFIIDDNPAKVGKFMPHTGIEVKDSCILQSGEIPSVISFAWRFMEEIGRRHQKFLETGGEFLVLDLPNVAIKKLVL